MSIFGKIKGLFSDGVTAIQRSDEVKKWLDELGEAEKREKDWRKLAIDTVRLYEQDGSSNGSTSLCDYNILYANTETLSPAVYNNTPRPVVKRKIDKDNPLGIAAAHILKATLVYLTDTGELGKATFDDLQKDAVQEALVAGRGSARFSYEPTLEGDQIKSETICGDQVPWNRVVFGYAKNWQNVPWRAYEHFMTKDELVDNFGATIAAGIKLTHMASVDDDKDKDGADPANAEGVKFAHIWEIWDKRDRKVKFISEGAKDVIKTADDPLKLEGFFDGPRPVMFLQRISSLQPQTLYQMYRKQAEELDKATRRISALLTALKVRGFYDGTLQGLDELMNKPENTLLPATNVAALQQGQTLEKSIWFMPLETLIVVLQQLYAARLQIINTIHQLTGIADIMRGASQASETLGAQEIKQAWGTMRLKRMQKEVQRFTRDCYRIQAELVAKHFNIETLKKMTGIQLPMKQEQEMARTQLQQLQQQAMMAQQQQQQQPPMPGMPPQAPPQQPPVDPAQLQQLQQVLSKPCWEDVVSFMRTDSICHYVVDIETNSTIDIEATEDKEELAEMMNSMSQLLNGIMPMVQEGVMPFDAAKALMLAVIGKFRLGDEVEESFRAMQQPQPKPDPAVQKAQAQTQMDQQSHDLDMKGKQADMQMQQQANAQQMELEREKLQLEKEKLQVQREKLQMESAFQAEQHRRDMEMIAVKATAEAAKVRQSASSGA